MDEEVKVIESDLKRKFEDLDDSLVAECVKTCQLYNLTGENFFYKWEVVRMGKPREHRFCLNDVHDVKAMIKRDFDRENITKKFTRANLMGAQSRQFGMARGRGRGGTSGLPGTPGRPVRRQDGFDLARGDSKLPIAGPSRVAFVGPPTDESSRKERSYRYMYEKVSERSEVLDDRIDHFGELVKAHYEVEELGDPSAVTEEEVVVVGRIVHDAESSSGAVKLNEASLMLESSRMMGSGARIPLRFDADVKLRQSVRNVGGQGLFPGAIVALKGKNGGGGSFSVTEFLSLPPLGPPSEVHIKSETSETQFSMYIACGPFTPDASLAYQPLQSLISKLTEAKPAVVLLLGPFIDSTHPAIKTGDVELPPREMFEIEFADRLRTFLDASPGSLILLVPSTRDILSDHAVFPQCELPRALCYDPRVRMLPNPARFTLNGVHIAVSSLDVLFHLRKEEFFKRASEVDPIRSSASPDAPDAMGNLCRHILQQRSFYPLFPVPLDLSHDVNLDVSHSDMLYLVPQDDDGEAAEGGDGDARARCAPDVLVVPSRLKHFAKVVDGTVAVNPSFLTKATYAVLEYAGHGVPGPAKDRIKVEIQRLEV